MPARKDEAVGVGGTGASNWSEPMKSSSMGLEKHVPDDETRLVEAPEEEEEDQPLRSGPLGATGIESSEDVGEYDYDETRAYVTGQDLPPEGAVIRRGRPIGSRTDKEAAARRRDPSLAVKAATPDELKRVQDEYAKVREEAMSDVISPRDDADVWATKEERPQFSDESVPWEEAERLEKELVKAGKLQTAYIRMMKLKHPRVSDRVLMAMARAEHPGLSSSDEARLNRFWADELEAERAGAPRGALRTGPKIDPKLAATAGVKMPEDDLTTSEQPIFRYGKEGKTGLQHFNELHPKEFQGLLKILGEKIKNGMLFKVRRGFPKPAPPEALSGATPGYDKRKVWGYYLGSLIHLLSEDASDDGTIFWTQFRDWDRDELEDGEDYRLTDDGQWRPVLLRDEEPEEAPGTEPEPAEEVDPEREEMKSALRGMWRMHSWDPRSGFEVQRGLEDVSPLEFSGRAEAAPGGEPERLGGPGQSGEGYLPGMEALGDPDIGFESEEEFEDPETGEIRRWRRGVPKRGLPKPPGPFDAPEEEWPEYKGPVEEQTMRLREFFLHEGGLGVVCPIHNYLLGQCPSCDGDPRPMLDYYEKHPEEVDHVVAPVLKYQRRRLPTLSYLKEGRGVPQPPSPGRKQHRSPKDDISQGSGPRPDPTDPTGMEGEEGPEPGENVFGPQEGDPPSHGFEDPTSSRDPEHGGFGEEGGGTTLEVPEGVFQGGAEGFGEMDEVPDEEGGEPTPGGPDDPEVAGPVGDPGFGREEDDFARPHQTGEPGPEHRTRVDLPEYEGDPGFRKEAEYDFTNFGSPEHRHGPGGPPATGGIPEKMPPGGFFPRARPKRSRRE